MLKTVKCSINYKIAFGVAILKANVAFPANLKTQTTNKNAVFLFKIVTPIAIAGLINVPLETLHFTR